VDRIKEKRTKPHQGRPILPFHIHEYGLHPSQVKLLVDASSLHPSDPNTLRDLGPTVYSVPQHLDVEQFEEAFSNVDQVESKSHLDQDEIGNDANIANDKDDLNENERSNRRDAEDDAESVKSQMSVLSRTSSVKSKLKEHTTLERVKVLAKRSLSVKSVKSGMGVNLESEEILRKLDALKKTPRESPLKQNKDLNPLLEEMSAKSEQ